MIILFQKKTTVQKSCVGCANEVWGFPTGQLQTGAMDGIWPELPKTGSCITVGGQPNTLHSREQDQMVWLKAIEKNEDTSVSAGSV